MPRDLLAVPAGALAAAAALVAGLAAAGAQPAGQGLPVGFSCSGNEPFWSLTVDGPDAAFSRPGEGGVLETALSGGGLALAFLDPAVFVWRGAPADPDEDAAGVGGDLVAAVERRDCRDTMADLPPFRYRAVVSLPDGAAVTGCCRAAEPADLVGTVWRVREVGGRAVAEDPRPTVGFERGRIAGSAGCNRYFGDLALDGRHIEVGDLASTRMMCPEPVMDREARLLAALSRAERYRFDGGFLVLAGPDGEPLLRLTPAEAGD
jgi:heat shock protein HslJ